MTKCSENPIVNPDGKPKGRIMEKKGIDLFQNVCYNTENEHGLLEI